MIKKLLLIGALSVTVSGCFMAPMAFIGPAASGFSTASIIQSGVTTGANYMVKKTTGKTVTEHVIDSFNKDIYHQTYLPQSEANVMFEKNYNANFYYEGLKSPHEIAMQRKWR